MSRPRIASHSYKRFYRRVQTFNRAQFFNKATKCLRVGQSRFCDHDVCRVPLIDWTSQCICFAARRTLISDMKKRILTNCRSLLCLGFDVVINSTRLSDVIGDKTIRFTPVTTSMSCSPAIETTKVVYHLLWKSKRRGTVMSWDELCCARARAKREDCPAGD